jgi:hypothetical protein
MGREKDRARAELSWWIESTRLQVARLRPRRLMRHLDQRRCGEGRHRFPGDGAFAVYPAQPPSNAARLRRRKAAERRPRAVPTIRIPTLGSRTLASDAPTSRRSLSPRASVHVPVATSNRMMYSTPTPRSTSVATCSGEIDTGPASPSIESPSCVGSACANVSTPQTAARIPTLMVDGSRAPGALHCLSADPRRQPLAMWRHRNPRADQVVFSPRQPLNRSERTPKPAHVAFRHEAHGSCARRRLGFGGCGAPGLSPLAWGSRLVASGSPLRNC